MRMTKYECARCHKEFDQRCHYQAHMSRKKLCGDSTSTIIPTMKNVKRTKFDKSEGITTTIENNSDCVISIDNSTDNSTTVHNHNTVNLVGFGEEDLSFVTPKFISSLLKIHEDDEDAVADLMKVVHFNPTRPENMNICADESTFNLFKDGKWNESKHEGDAAIHVAKRYADKILKHIELDDDMPDSAPEDRSDSFHDFHQNMQRSPDIERTFIEFIRKHSCMVTCKNEFGEFMLMVPKASKRRT